jgi:motility quorum-sensing regulator/GCU-specific mRNA interferase toxin
VFLASSPGLADQLDAQVLPKRRSQLLGADYKPPGLCIDAWPNQTPAQTAGGLDEAPLRCHIQGVEKRTPHYALDSMKATFTTVESLRMTVTARNSAFGLGLVLTDVVRIIQGMTREQFYKSMTSVADHRVWQDVYHVPFETTVLYVKFTTDAQGHLVISFKEK